MKKQIYYLGTLLSVASCIYFIYHFQKNFSDLPSINKGTYTYLLFFITILLSSLPVILGAFGWTIILRSLKMPVSTKDCIIIYVISQFGKYLPGNFGHHLGRVSLSLSSGLNFSCVFLAMLLEVYLSAISGFVLSVVALSTLNTEYRTLLSTKLPNHYEFIGIGFIFVLIFLFCASLVYKNFNKSLFSVFSEKFFSAQNFSALLTNLIFHTLSFFCMGMVMNILAVGIFDASQCNVFLLTGIFSTAWLIGFITPGAPAGLGVRETILVIALEPFYGPAIALGVSAFLRIITTFSDGVTFVTAFAIKKWVYKPSPRSQ